MEIDILIYFGVAVLIGALVLGFITEWDFVKDSEDLSKFYLDEDTGREFQKKNPEGFSVAAFEYFKQCNYSTMAYNESYYVYSEDIDLQELNRSVMFGFYLNLQWCGTIQSKNLSCGWREDVNISPSELPEIFELSCINGTLFIRPIG